MYRQMRQHSYNEGLGMYNTTARSFYNVNPVYNPEDNGRASPQFPTQHIPIYNPAMTTEHMYTQAQASRNFINQGGIVNYATRGLHAENYSLLESQASAQSYSNLFSGLGRATSIASIVGGLALGSNPLGLMLMGGAVVGERIFDKYKRYYQDFGDRMGRIANIRSAFSGNSAIVNPSTGVMSGADASRFADMLANSASGSAFTEQDMYSIHTMASRAGLMRGHTGSLGKAAARIASVAKMTKRIMDMGEGISQGQAMEIQSLSQKMDIDLNKFQALNISDKILSAAKLTNKTISATTAILESSAATSTQLGLGGQVGVESALYHSRFASPQFGYLSAKQQASVGGSQEAYVQNLVRAQLNFASRNASNLALGSYYIDPTTGAFKIDTNEVYAMAHRGLDPDAEYKRGMQILNKENRRKLKTAGINQNLVTNLLRENLGSLGKQAIGEVSSDLQTAMSIQEIVRTAASNNLSFNQAAEQLGYDKEQVAALKAFSQNYGKGAERVREQDRLSYRRELQTRAENSQFITTSQRRDLSDRLAEKREANLDAAIASMRADRAREEAVGIYGGRNRTYSDEVLNAVLQGSYNAIEEGPMVGRRLSSRYRHGVYLGLREQDVERGFLSKVFHYGGHEDAGSYGFGTFKRSISETAAGKEVLSKLFATDFYGPGSDVSNENIFGVDTSIMGRLAAGSIFSTNDLNRTFHAKDTIRRALGEIYGTNKTDTFESLLNTVQFKDIRDRLTFLSKGDESGNLTGATSDELSKTLAALAIKESAAFSPIGRSLRTETGRRGILSGIKGDKANANVNEAAFALRDIIQQAVDSNSDFFANNNMNLAVQTSRNKMAKQIFNTGKSGFESEREVLDNLDSILARLYQIGDPNARKTLDKTFQFAEKSLSLSGAPTLTYAADSVIGNYKISPKTDKVVTLNEALAAARYGSTFPVKLPAKQITKHLTLSQLVLGSTEVKGEEASRLIADKAVTLTNAVQKVSEINPKYRDPGKAQEAVATLIHSAINYILKQGGNDSNFNGLFEAFLSENEDFSKLLAGLDGDHVESIKRFIREKVNDTGVRDYFTKSTAKDFAGTFGAVLTVGKKEIGTQAVENFVEGSTTMGRYFGKGKTKESYAQSLIGVFQKLRDEATFKKRREFITDSGGVDTNAILKALGFNLENISKEDASQLRGIASQAFGRGTFDKSSIEDFGEALKKQIQAGKMKSVSESGAINNADAIQSAIRDMLSLQRATATLLTALASGDSGKLTEVATILQGLQGSKK